MGVSAGVDASRVDVKVLEETNLEALTIRLDVDIGTFSSVDLSGLNRACSLATDRDGGTGAWCDTDFSGVDDSWSVIVRVRGGIRVGVGVGVCNNLGANGNALTIARKVKISCFNLFSIGANVEFLTIGSEREVSSDKVAMLISRGNLWSLRLLGWNLSKFSCKLSMDFSECIPSHLSLVCFSRFEHEVLLGVF